MKISPALSARSGLSHIAVSVLMITLAGCSTPHGYGVDERAMRTPDGSSGVVAGDSQAAKPDPSPAMHSQTTYLSLITQMQHEGQNFAALAHLDGYELRYGKSPESTLLRGDAERLTGQPEAAAASYLALKGTPLASSGYRGLSLLAAARGDFGAASSLLEDAVRLNSTDAVSLSDLGYARMKQGDLPAARIPLMTAAQLAPANPKVMSNLALYLLLDGQPQEAESLMNGASMNLQTRQAIQQQAASMDQGATLMLARGSAAGADQGSPLRIDFALATPISGSSLPATELAQSQH